MRGWAEHHESGVVRDGNLGTYVAGDVFRVAVQNGVVSYSRAGSAPFYTSAVTPSFPLRVDTSEEAARPLRDANPSTLGVLPDGTFVIGYDRHRRSSAQ